jgi:hypothetical protein
MGQISCASCLRDVDESDAIYGEDGMICLGCEGAEQVASGFHKGFWGLATSALGMALLSFCFNPFLMITVASVISAVQTFRYPSSLDEEDRAVLGSLTAPLVFAGLALAINLFQVLVLVLGIVGMIN